MDGTILREIGTDIYLLLDRKPRTDESMNATKVQLDKLGQPMSFVGVTYSSRVSLKLATSPKPTPAWGHLLKSGNLESIAQSARQLDRLEN